MIAADRAACDEKTVVAMLGFLKGKPFTKSNPLVAAPGELYELLIEGGFVAASLPVMPHSARTIGASLTRVASELRRRGVHVESARSVPSTTAAPPLDQPPRNALRIWCDENAVLRVVERADQRARGQGAPQPTPGERPPLSAAAARRPMRRAQAG